LLFSRLLLDGSKLLQLLRREHGLDLGAALLPNLHYFLLLLLHAQGVVVAHCADLFVFIVHDGSDLLLLVLRELEFVLDGG